MLHGRKTVDTIVESVMVSMMRDCTVDAAMDQKCVFIVFCSFCGTRAGGGIIKPPRNRNHRQVSREEKSPLLMSSVTGSPDALSTTLLFVYHSLLQGYLKDSGVREL